MSVFRYQIYMAGLPGDLKCVLNAEPGKLDIKRRKPGILFTFYQFTHWFTLQSSDVIRFNVIDGVIQKVQRHHDLIKVSSVNQVNV